MRLQCLNLIYTTIKVGTRLDSLHALTETQSDSYSSVVKLNKSTYLLICLSRTGIDKQRFS